jgi:hypothetical protein
MADTAQDMALPAARAGRASPKPASGLGRSATIPNADFVLRRYVVSVEGWGESTVLAASRGKAMADSWRSDAFEGYSFGAFLKIARCRLDWWQPKPKEITVLGKRALYLGHNRQYVQFVYPGAEVVLNAHPYDVLPEDFRPAGYRTAQAIEARRAATTGAVEDESAVRRMRPNPSTQGQPPMTTNTKDVLRPCPFCGGEAEAHRFSDYDLGHVDHGYMRTIVGCPECEEPSFTRHTTAEAITAWNTRQDTNLARMREALETARSIVATVAMYDGSAPVHGRFASIPAITARRAKLAISELDAVLARLALAERGRG